MRALFTGRPMLFAAVVFTLVGCMERGDPTDPGTPQTPHVITVALRLPVTSLEVGHVVSAIATPLDDAGAPVPSASVQWSSSDTGVVTVSTSGQLSARRMGTATIYATSEGVAGQGAITVTDSIPAAVVISPPAISAAVGSHVQLSAAVSTQTGRALPGHVIVWSSTDTRYATVTSSGVVTGAATGSARVIARASGVADTATVSVSTAAVAALSVTPPSTTIASGATVQLSARVTDASGNALAGRVVAWATSDASIASVSASGLVTGAKTGNATITATSEGKSDASAIHVAVGPVSTVTISPPSGSILEGRTLQLAATLRDAAGNTVTGRPITWASSRTSVASVTSSGLVTGMASGSASISATADGKSKTAAITVTTATTNPPPPAPVPPPPGPGPGVQAVWSDKFVSSVGIATHFSYFDLLPYNTNVNSTIAAIKNAGFRFVRDGLSVQRDAGWNNRYWGALKSLTQQGLKLVLITQPGVGVGSPYNDQSNLDTAVNRIGASNILAFEGPNEVDNNSGNWGGVPAFGTNARTYQAAMYRHAKQIAPAVTVIGLTTTTASGANYVGDISAYMDAATMHPYPMGGVPTKGLSGMEHSLAALNLGNKTWWVTETGYFTAPNATQNVYQPGVSETAQGKYASRLYLDYFKAGISHTAVYELVDERHNGVSGEDNFGLMHNDGSPKPAYTAIKNLLGLLADPGGNFTPGTLSYTVTGTTGTIRQSLFQKHDGRFYLVLWNDVSVYDTQGKRDISNAAVPVTVTFASAHNVSIYQPYMQAGALSSSASVTTLSIPVPDHPVVVEINP